MKTARLKMKREPCSYIQEYINTWTADFHKYLINVSTMNNGSQFSVPFSIKPCQL